MAEGEGADDERAGTTEHRPQHAQHTETTSPGVLSKSIKMDVVKGAMWWSVHMHKYKQRQRK